jgi:hypothetical protein
MTPIRPASKGSVRLSLWIILNLNLLGSLPGTCLGTGFNLIPRPNFQNKKTSFP